MTASKGGSGFGNQDDVIFIPLTTQQQLLVGDTHLSRSRYRRPMRSRWLQSSSR